MCVFLIDTFRDQSPNAIKIYLNYFMSYDIYMFIYIDYVFLDFIDFQLNICNLRFFTFILSFIYVYFHMSKCFFSYTLIIHVYTIIISEREIGFPFTIFGNRKYDKK